jgi:hypothetical protein
MARVLHFAAVTLVGFVCAAVSGCASSGAKEGSGSATTTGGMMCPTCKTVWTFDTVGQGTKMQRLEASPSMTCPTCDEMAAAYMKDGAKVVHNCETCKVTPTVLTPSATPLHSKGTHTHGGRAPRR